MKPIYSFWKYEYELTPDALSVIHCGLIPRMYILPMFERKER